MNRNWLIGPSFAILALVGIAGCKSTPTDTVGTETNWLMACDRDADCGELSCLCGVCTTTCASDAQCSQVDAVCGPLGSGAAERLCGSTDPDGAGLCLRAGCTGADCITQSAEPLASGGAASTVGGNGGGGESNGGADPSMGGSQGAQGGDGGSSTPGGGSSGGNGSNAGGTAGAAGSAGSGSNGEPLNLSGTVDISQAITDPETTGAGACADQSVTDVLDAIHATAPELSGIDQLYSTEVFNDANTVYAFALGDGFRFVLKTGSGDCPAGCISSEYWYFQTDINCVPVDVGHYSRAFNGTGNCFDVTGTPLWDLPAATPADAICSSSECADDSCRPEVCDEVGEPCCDPSPGDGPNYCNSGLECSGTSCAAPASSESEGLCTSSGGTWVPNSCGDYSCGLAPNCDAVIPGCNCGPYKNFGDTGCAVDDQCDTASLPFTCGEATCTSVGEQYCEEQTNGSDKIEFACRDIPDSCFATALECGCSQLEDAIPDATCRAGFQGEFIVALP